MLAFPARDSVSLFCQEGTLVTTEVPPLNILRVTLKCLFSKFFSRQPIKKYTHVILERTLLFKLCFVSNQIAISKGGIATLSASKSAPWSRFHRWI